MNNPKTKAWLGLVAGSVLMALTFFISAGTIHYWQAWVYLVVNAVCSTLLTLYIIQDRILLESRTKYGPVAEKRPIQKIVVICSGFPGIAVFIVPALDHRFGWSSVPSWLSVLGVLLMVLSMWMVYRVFKENSFGSATIEITKEQKVVSTGPYAIVRNPMYSSAGVYLIGTPLALGSYLGLIPSVLTILGLVWRLFDEERFLEKNLAGYSEYCGKVRWHLIPGVF